MSEINEFLASRFNEHYAAHLGRLLTEYKKSGLASPHLVEEVVSGEDGKLWSRVWEAMLYRHLVSLGFQPHSASMKKSGERGPDFSIVHKGQTIWVEAVTPAPEGIPSNYLEPPKKGVVEFKPVLNEQPLLRWTSVLRDKRKKLETDKKQGVIGDQDCTIIAVSSCRLHDWRPNDLGVSRFPFAVEAVFPIGPVAYPVSVDGQPAGEPANIPRYEIPKTNNSSVPTTSFLNPDYANVSAILGCYHKPMMNSDYQRTGANSLTLVHNPLAAIPLPRGILGVEKEYFAEKEGERYILRWTIREGANEDQP
jgi:type I restriction enzyme S subunit